VGLTAGLVKPSTLTRKGKSRNAPETPAGAVKVETKKATRKGMRGLTSTPEVGNTTYSFLIHEVVTVIQEA